MPYVKIETRQLLAEHMFPKNPGELNYLITTLMLRYWSTSSRNYAALNDMVGACEGAKLEMYRRLAAPYEDEKIKQNGDVY